MTTFCPSTFSSSPAVMRVTWSVEPPAAHGTMTVIGFVGFHCAAAPHETATSATTAATRTKRRARCIVFLLLLEVDLPRAIVLTDSLKHCNAAARLTTLRQFRGDSSPMSTA